MLGKLRAVNQGEDVHLIGGPRTIEIQNEMKVDWPGQRHRDRPAVEAYLV
jgi:hypothetical protein